MIRSRMLLPALVGLAANAVPVAAQVVLTDTVPGVTAPIELVRVPAGTVELKRADGTARVDVGSFWMMKTEVPWELYDPWVFARTRPAGVDAVTGPSKPYVLPGESFGHEGRPALGMTLHAARRFAEWVSARTGKRYRLPTEAEWLHACRAGSGDAPRFLREVAWTAENSESKTQPPGTRQPNPFGLHDLLGNAAEWVETGDSVGVVMGGAWDDEAADVRCDVKRRYSEFWQMTDPQMPKSRWWLSDAPFVGMRLVREADPSDPR